MARKATKKSKQEKNLKPGDVKQLWRKVTPQEWLTLLQRINREGKWSINGHTIKGCCPYHDDSTPSFFLNFDKCLGKCFGSCGKVVTDLVQLVAKLQKSSYVAALTWLNTELNISEIIGEGAEELVEYNAQQEMKKDAAEAMRKVMQEFVRDKPRHLDYLLPAMRYLVHGRKIPLDCLYSLPLGIFAKPEHVKKYMKPENHELYDTYFSKVSGPAFYGGICFHYNNAPGCISRFKIRKMQLDAEDVCSRYSRGADMPYDIVRNLADKSFVIVDDQFINDIGVFGLHHYNRMIGSADANAYITEGEFDAISVMVSQLKEGRDDFMIFAIGGNGNSGLSFLRELGIRTLWLVQDAPHKNGDDVAKRLLLNKKNFVGDSVNRPLAYKIFCWTSEMLGGDLDEAIQIMGYDSVFNFLYNERSSYFVNYYSWVLRKCDAEIAAMRLDVENECKTLEDTLEDRNRRENLENSLTAGIAATVKNWLGCVHEQVDKLTFVQKYTMSENIDFEKLQEVNTTIYALDTVDGAVARLRDALREHLEVVYYESTKSGSQFTLWSKTAFETAAIPMNDSGMELVLSQYLGKDLLVWAKQLLGGSPLLLSKSSGDEITDQKRIQQNILFLLRRTMLSMVSESRQISKLRIVGQGIHYADLPGAKAEGHVYFVNGTKVFRGELNPSSGAPIEWEFVNSAVDGNLLFTLHPGKKWSDVEDVAELYAGTQVDLRLLYDQVREILDAWKFEHHDVMRDYLAAWIMSLPIQRAMGMVNITFLTGESTSGKTSFVRGLLGGYGSSGYDVPYIVESAKYSSDATAAWIYQEMDQTALLLSLDEAEARQDNAHSSRVADIQQMMFSIPTGGARMSRGGSSADQRADYFLQMPVIMAAINMSSDPVFLTRVVVVYTQKDLQRRNVGDYIADRFSDAQIQRIRAGITTGMLSHLPELCRRMQELRGKLGKVETSTKVTSRYINSLLPALVIYDYLGFDAVHMFKCMVDNNRPLLESLNFQDFQSEILNAVLYSEGVKTMLDDNIAGFSSPKALIMSGDFHVLNNSGCGVKILPEKKWIVIFWRDAKQTLLRTTIYRNMSEAALRELIAKNVYVITDITPDDHNYIVETLGRGDIKHSSGYSVINSAYLLTEEQQERMLSGAVDGYGNGSHKNTYKKSNKRTNNDIPDYAKQDIPIEAYENAVNDSNNCSIDDSTDGRRRLARPSEDFGFSL